MVLINIERGMRRLDFVYNGILVEIRLNFSDISDFLISIRLGYIQCIIPAIEMVVERVKERIV